MRRRAPRTLSFALQRVTAELEPASLLAQVQRHWLEAVGETIDAEARPVSESGGVVTVACHSSVWANELHLMPDLLEKLNGALGDTTVEELRFVGPGGRRSHPT